jgi:hypothetical protein
VSFDETLSNQSNKGNNTNENIEFNPYVFEEFEV